MTSNIRYTNGDSVHHHRRPAAALAKWGDLVRVGEQDKPRFVLTTGDILPSSDGLAGQREFSRVLADFLGAVRSEDKTILTFFGNDDFHRLESSLTTWSRRAFASTWGNQPAGRCA